jgi:DNA-binding transcriptional LysR family regulator
MGAVCKAAERAEAGGRSRPFSLIYPDRRHTPLRVRAFIDFLIAELRIPTP